MGRRAIRVNGRVMRKNGRAIGKTIAAPCCCGCFYWKASLCNQTVCVNFPLEVYVCTTALCPDRTPIHNGSVIGSNGYCYRVDDSVLYCPPPSGRFLSHIASAGIAAVKKRLGVVALDCVPLPIDAIIVRDFVCFPDCSPGSGCPPIDGWFPANPCLCPGQGGLTHPVFVKCSIYYQSVIAKGPCPSWRSSQGCVYVRRDAVPQSTTPPGSELIETLADYSNCCECCGTGGQGCCYFNSPSVHIDFTPTGPITTYGAQSYCCWVQNQWQADASGVFLIYQDFFGFMCLIEKREAWTAGNIIYQRRTTYDYNATQCQISSIVGDVFQCFVLGGCGSAQAVLDTMIGECLAGLGFEFNGGTEDANCTSASISAFRDDLATAHYYYAMQGTATVNGGTGCGTPNCGGNLDIGFRGFF